jgi:hypothetical protein
MSKMSKLPYGLAPTHLTGHQVYKLYRGELTDRWSELSGTDTIRWHDLARWINERATAQIDVTEKVAEKMTGQSKLDDFDTAVTSELKNPLVGANIHDDDIAAAALRFYKEYGPKPKPPVEEPSVKPSTGVTEEPKVPSISLVEVIDAAAMLLKAVLK